MMKNLYSRLSVCKWLLFSVFFSMTVSSWAQKEPTVTPAFDQICRDEPVSVSITANSPFHAGDTLQWWIASSNVNGNNPTRWTKYKQSTSTTLVVDKMPDGYGNDMYVWVTDYKEDCPDGKKNKAAHVGLKPNDQCPNIQCRETATGEVTSFGTDFTPLYGQQNITFYGRGNEIEETFPPNTSLTVRPGYEGTIVSQSYELEHYGFDGILPPSDEENYFLRLNRGGADQTYPVDLNFWKPDYHVGRNNISYNIVMRSYYSIACTSDHGEYRFSVETTTGNEMKNARVTVVVVDMADPTQYYTCTVLIPNVSDHPVLDLTGRPRGTSGMIIANENQGDGPLKGVKLLEGHTYQIDCIFYGTFSGSRRDYTYQPKFFFPSEDSDGRKCAKNQYLLDYINYETEGVCVTPRTACLGEWIDVKATGFPYDATQIWQVKRDNGQYVNVPASEIQYEDATRKHVKILMSREGTVSYRVVSSLDSNDYFDFTMTGEDCSSLISPSIQGDPLVCVSATENTATYKVVNTESLIWMSSTPEYNWELKDPTGATVSSYLNQTTGEDVTITFPATAAMSADNANKPYELSMTPSVGGYSYDNYKKTVEIIVNRTPDLSGVIMDIPEVCPAIEKTDTIVLRNAEGVLGNSFKWYVQDIEWEEGYTDLLKPDSLEVNFGHRSSFCDLTQGVDLPIKYVSENNGCKDSLEGVYHVDKMRDPQIVCPADTVCALDENCEYHGYVVVPEVSSSVDCGDSVKTIEWVRPGLPDTVVSVGDVLDLPKGDNLFVYKIVDNCGHVGSCTRTVSVKDMTNPEVVCPPDTTLYLKSDGCYLSLEMPIATGSDNCSNVNVDLDFWYSTPNNPTDQMASRGNEYYVPKINPTFDLCDEDNYIIWFAVDAAGNKSEECKQNITLADSFPPVISCPAVKNVDLTSSCKGSVQISAPNVSDNTNNCSYCNSVPSAYQVALYYSLDDGASYTQWTKTNGETLTLESGPDTLHVLWVAVDYFNNHSDTCDQVIVFRDMADPEIVCPDDVTAYAHISCDEEVEIGLATATDNCGIDSILYSLDGGAFVDANDSKVSVTVHVGSHTVTWKAVDVNGRSATCTQNVDLLDSLGMEKHCPTEPDVEINTCTDLTWAEVLAQLSASQKATMGSTDCSTGDGTSIDPTMFYKSQTATVYEPMIPSTNLSMDTLYDIKWLFEKSGEDVSTMKDSCFSTVLLTDKSDPVTHCENIVPITLRPKGCDTVYTVVPPTGVFSDVCTDDADLQYVFYLDGRGEFSYGTTDSMTFRLSNGGHWITWAVLDEHGNVSDTCGHAINVVDNNPPVIECAPVADIQLDVTTGCDTTIVLTSPEVKDSCGVAAVYYKMGDGVEHLYTAGSNSITISVGDTLVKWYAKDATGNTSDTCESVYTVNDVVAPKIACPSDTAFKLYQSCDTTFTLTFPHDSDNCSVTNRYYRIGTEDSVAYTAPFSHKFLLGETTITWISYDATKNRTECVRHYSVTDSSSIMISCPKNDNLTLDVCEDMAWSNVKGSLTGDYAATATRTDCQKGVNETLTPTFYYKKQSEGESAYVALTDASTFSLDIAYDVKWMFEKGGGDLEEMKDSCISHVLLTDISDPVTHCENIVPITLRPKGCDTVYTVVPPTGVFSDVCTDDADLQYIFYLDGRGEFSYGTTDSMTFRLSNGGHWITWAVLDEHGNVSDTCGHAINVVDNNPPVIECAPVADIQLDVTTGCDTTIVLTSPEVKDSCGVAAVYYKMGDGVEHLYTAGSNMVTISVGDTLVKWYAKDATGNTSDTCESVYTVKDVAKPEVVCPSDVQVKVYTRCDTTLTLAEPTVSDNCSYKLYYTIGSESEKLYESAVDYTFNLGTTVVTWRAVDPSANEKSCTVSYTVTDSSSIMISCPKNDSLTLDVCQDMVWSDVKGSLTGDYAANASRTDCQNGVNETLTPTFYYKKQSEGESAYVALTDASTFSLDIAYDVKWMFEKGGGDLEEMKDSCISHVLLTDTTAPAANCNIVMPSLEPYGCDTLYLLEAPIGAFHDNCTPDDQLLYRYAVDTAEFVHFEDNIGGNKIRLPIGSHEVFWYAEDEHGNKSDTCSYTLVVKDILPPTVECETYGIPTLEVTQRCDTTLKIGAPKVTDCDTFNIYYRMGNGDERLYSDSLLVTFAVGDTLVKWYAKDTTGNVSDTCFAKYTVKDVAKPVITCPADNFEWKLRFHCDSTIVLEEPTASDNCSYEIYYKIGDEDEALYPSSGVSYNFPLGSTNVRWRAVDPSGNESTCTVVYTLKDSSGINISCPAEPDLTIDVCADSVWSFVKTYLKGKYAASARQMDCAKGDSTDLTPTFFYKKTSESDNSYVALVDASRFVLDENYDIKWLFSKEGENATSLLDSCISHVVLTDTTAPSSDCDAMKDIVLKPITCDTSYQFGKPLGVFDDICGEENLTYYYKLDDASDFVQLTDGVKNLLGSGTHKVVWRVEDAHHNVSKTCEQIVSVLDTIPPTIACAPIADINLEITTACDTTPSIEAPAVTDACDTFVVYYRIGNGDTAMYHGAITPTLPVGETVIKWFAQDTSGNVSDTCFSTYTVTDVAAPIFDCPSDTAFKVYHNCDTTFSISFPIVNDNCDVTKRFYRFGTEDSVAYTESVAHKFSLGETTVTWIAYDAADNRAVCERKYSVTDNTSITASCPSQDDVVIDTCESLTWSAVLALYTDEMKAVASRLDCANDGNVIDIDPIMSYKKSSESVYTDLSGTTLLEYNTLYDLRWKFEKNGENMESLDTACYSQVILRDTSAPTRNCEMMQDIVLKPIACDSIGYVIEKPDGVFDDNCDESNLTYYFKMDDDAAFTEFTGSNGRDVTNGTHTVVWKVADKMGNESDTCWQTITIIDTVAPTITCPADTSIALTTGCEVDVTLRPAVPEDNCGPDSVYYSFDNVKFEALSTLTSTLDKHLSVGSYTVSWFTVDIHGVHSDTCQQKVSILDDHAIDIDCPTNPEDGPFIVEACTDLPWKDLNDSLTALNMNASASYTECATSSVVPIDSIIMKVSKSGENNWSVMDDDYVIDYNTAYDIRWIFVKAGDNLVTKSDSCFLSVLVKDTTAPDFNCDDIDPDSVVYIAHGVCELPYSDITLNKYTAHDNCDGDIVGILSTSKNLADSVKADDVFKVGTLYHLYWVFEDKTGNNVSCDQLLMLNSDLKPLFNCDSLKNSPITKLLHDACVTDFADLAITTPIAYDACTKDPIMGVGHRKSGEAMNGSYAVGRDTIVWVFKSIYSTALDSCEQYIFIRSDKKLDFDCDSLNKAVIDTVLQGVCEIDSASLNFTAPFALDVCTNDTIWGVGVRKSGEPMDGIYKVGRDTISWTFISDYSTDTVVCDQYIYIKSDKDLLFDCDSLNNAPIERILHDVCEIDSAGLNMIVPFALDACTNDTIWGVGVRKSGEPMGGTYKVGRDTISWTFISEYSTDTVVCEQFIYISSDKKLDFDCDSLNKAVIERVLHGVCETDSVGMNFTAPFALDACTNDTIWGVGARKSGEPMDGTYKVGRDTISWTFISEYSTDTVVCDQYVFIKSDKDLDFDCDSLNKAVIERVLHGVCETDSASMNMLTPFALDVCTNDTIWGVGVRKSGEPMDGIYKVGRDTISWTFISEYSTDTVVCDQYIYIKSDKDLLFDCDSLNNAPIERILHDVCEIDSAGLNMIVPFALDACTNDTIWGVGVRKSGEPMGGTYKVGRDTISWTFISEYSTDTVVCEQFIYISSDKKLDFDCDSLNKAVIERVLHGVCETDSVGMNFTAPFALDACTNDTIWGVGARKSGEPMNGTYKVGRDTITWTFISEYSTDTVVCDQYIYIQSDKDLLFDCDSLNNAPIERVLSGVCETDSASLNFTVPFALDACTNDTIWGVGVRKSGEPMNGTYKVGRDTITWTFISEYSTDTVVCDQYLFIQSDKDLLFDCDSLNNAPIERVLSGVCETDSVGLNFMVPFALDACTNDTIWGVGARKSGEPMNGTYKVGRDTITWTFISEYSTDTVVCDQYIYIQSDKDLLFDCDSLNNAPIERVLSGVCETDSASLNFTVPFALDACTKDTIWGVGVRKSGEPMNGVYKVGRDTISWTFIGEYSTDTVVCDQYVYIQSDIKPKFDCDSLHNAPIERVLNGVCEIDSAGLNMIVPFALDACTNDTIWGRGSRTSGEPMGGTYKVGRDTIIWVFDSEYSIANDTCEQYIFIQSDLKPKFDCDSLHESPIHKVLVDTCIVSPTDLNINTPFALDACTNDTIWGVGTRKSGKLMTDNYQVGRDTIVWVFDSEYSTSNDTCEQYVFIQSNIKPIFDCDSLKNAKIEKVLEDVCEISAADLNVNIPFALDACTNDTVWGVGTRTSGRAMDASYVVGHDTIVWKFISEFSTDSAVCEQYVFIQSNKGLEFDCDSLKNTPITRVLHGVCEVDSATLNFIVPFAMDGCMNDTVWGVGYRKSGEPMGGTYKVGRDTIVWKFSSEFVIDELICEQPIFIQSDIAPKFDCDSLKKEVIDTVLHGVCEIDSASLNFNVPFALDACTNDTVWGVGTRTSGLSMGDPYKVGRDTIVWTFTSEFSTESSVCEQYIFIQSDLAPVVDCDSLKANPIEKDLHGVCEVVSDSMNLIIPFALDACTNDTIWGVGTRTSGLAMDGIYKVGRDTIIWKFKSEFSTDSTLCEQYLLIRSDLQPVVDCDSLKNAVIDTVLHEVCEIEAADFNIIVPFALDACTNDTIWGEGSRTSGLDMSASYHVGRDTIVWRFVSPYSTDTTICEQPVFVRSDKSLDFDCDSLKNAPIERVLEGVCEIAASELDVNTPYAVDACTNEKIYGVGTRTSGRGMDDAYVVGRDTIVWTFISEFSTDTVVCEQSVFIQSDMAPKFNCDSLKQEVIDTVLHGVCEISAADLNIHTPVAFDACTNDSVLGVGYRKSGKEMTDNYSVGRDTIVWVFDSEYSTLNDTCEQYVYIQSDMKPTFDCDSLHNAPITKVLSGVCSISSTDLNVATPFALDACTKDTVWGVGYRTSGKSMADDYVVGYDTIVWVFDSEFSTNSDTCEQYVFIQSDLAPKFDCDSLKNSPIEKVLNGVCEISAADLNVNTPFALDACTNDTIWGVGRRTSGRDMDSSYVVGHDTIVWTFTSVYSTTAADCEQYVFIQSDMAPKFDCDSLRDTVLYIAMDQCVIPAGQFVMETPVAKDACTDENVVGVPSRSDTLALEDAYPVGVTTLTWTFTSPLSTTPLSCSMTVTVLDTFPPVPNCEDLDTIHADITVASLNKTFTTYEEAVKAGLVSPTVEDLCDGTITATGVREDGSPLEGNFEIGNTTIVWTFTDNSGNSAICTQVVKVEDHGVDTLFCPGNLDGSQFVCLEEIPSGFDSFEAFKAAGGSFTTESKIVEGSFRYTDEYDGDSCSMIVTRTYMVTDTRGDIDSCQEIIYVKDTVAPKFDIILRDTTLSCEDSIFEADTVTATDNCNGGVTVRLIETNDRTDDVSSCDYYNYNITRTYVASDRCGNRDTMIQHIFIRDTIGPKFNYPANWNDTVLAKTLKGCQFEVPDLTMSVKSMTEDNCTENERLTIRQVPAPGSSIGQSMYVWVYVSDMCGNEDSTSKFVRVQQLDAIVSLTAVSRDTCVSDEEGVSLASQLIRFASGLVEDVRPDGTIRRKPSVFCFDYYRGAVSRENLMFSENPYTYRDEFIEYVTLYGNLQTASEELTKLHQRSESGFYSFVAMDTSTGCSDTATAYINVLERPKVKIVSAQMPVCEGNYLNLDPYLQCVDSMGTSITDEYWMVDTMKFDPYDSIMGKVSSEYNGKLISYYAENRCGSTSSLNSHALLNCYDDSLTTKDSLTFLEGDSAALTMLRLNQIYSRDSILLDVHTRFNPDSIIIETEPHDPARIWRGESVTLALNTKYDYHYLVWHKVVGKYDMENYDSSVGEGFFFNDPDDEEDEIYEISGFKERPYILDYPEDTTSYYVTITDGVCPETPSSVTEVDVLQEIPTAFTPFVKDGYNDVFMERHHVVIYDRYGQKVFVGDNGWPGTHKGHQADPGVYFYELVMGNGLIIRGTIEVVKID